MTFQQAIPLWIRQLWWLLPITARSTIVGLIHTVLLYLVLSFGFEKIVGEPMIIASAAGQTPSALNPNVFLGILTLYGVLVGYQYNNDQQTKRDIATRHYPEKRKVVKTFFDILFKAQAEHENPQRTTLSSKLTRQLSALRNEMAVWASPELVRAFNEFVNTSNRANFGNSRNVLNTGAKVMAAF